MGTADWNNPRVLPPRSHYQKEPVLANDEELVEYREPASGAKIPVYVGEIVLGTHGERFPFGDKYVEDGWFNAGIGRGRYIVKKKGTVTKSKNQEVVMSEQKPLSYKRETLIDALKDAVTENERKREEDKRKKLEKDRKGVDQVIAMMKSNPSFAGQMLCQAAALTGPEIRSWEDVDTEAFKESVRKLYPVSDEEAAEFDAELKKLIRVYEKAEDETVEVHVHDTVYSYL